MPLADVEEANGWPGGKQGAGLSLQEGYVPSWEIQPDKSARLLLQQAVTVSSLQIRDFSSGTSFLAVR